MEKPHSFADLMPRDSNLRRLLFDAVGEWLRQRPGASLELTATGENAAGDIELQCVARTPAGREVTVYTHLMGWNGETFQTLARACELYETRHDPKPLETAQPVEQQA